jgi:hypothetical protein
MELRQLTSLRPNAFRSSKLLRLAAMAFAAGAFVLVIRDRFAKHNPAP